MDRLDRAAIITRLAGELRKAGSWCGETHIQKAMYLLQDLLDVPSEFPFILYRHGPFSFDLSDALTALRTDELLALEPQAPPYGPRYAPTKMSARLEKAYANTLTTYDEKLSFAANVIDGRTVGDLERLGTALYVTKRRKSEHDGSVQSRAECLNRLKSHISVQSAAKAVEEIDKLIAQIEESTD